MKRYLKVRKGERVWIVHKEHPYRLTQGKITKIIKYLHNYDHMLVHGYGQISTVDPYRSRIFKYKDKDKAIAYYRRFLRGKIKDEKDANESFEVRIEQGAHEIEKLTKKLKRLDNE